MVWLIFLVIPLLIQCGQEPIGTIDSILFGEATGWFYDPDSKNSQVLIKSEDKIIANGITNIYRPDVCKALGVEGNFGFKIKLEHKFAVDFLNLFVYGLTADDNIIFLQNSPLLTTNTKISHSNSPEKCLRWK